MSSSGGARLLSLFIFWSVVSKLIFLLSLNVDVSLSFDETNSSKLVCSVTLFEGDFALVLRLLAGRLRLLLSNEGFSDAAGTVCLLPL